MASGMKASNISDWNGRGPSGRAPFLLLIQEDTHTHTQGSARPALSSSSSQTPKQ